MENKNGEYFKDFDRWNKISKKINGRDNSKQIFKKGEVWWCNLGVNIGSEQDGTGHNFERPVLIVKKFSRNTVLIFPITSKDKAGNYYYKIINGNSVSLCQPKLVDIKRLSRRIKNIKLLRKEFKEIVRRFKHLL